MTSRKTLQDKWFIDVTAEGRFPPQTRHPAARLQPYTDGNLVEPLIEGATIMGDFADRVEAIMASKDPGRCGIWVAAMGLDPIKLKGENGPAEDVITTMLNAAAAGVDVYFLGSGQGNLGPVSKRFAEKLIEHGSHGSTDKRFPGMTGGHHQKFNITKGPNDEWAAIVSSADFFFTRWDTADHLPDNPDRPPKGGPTHDIGFKVRGPAVHDIALTFAERWNDASSAKHTDPPIDSKMPTDFLDTPLPAMGPHSVQVLRTYPLIDGNKGYSWSNVGEYTIWAAYLKAIKNARQYIYIEDQYLYTFGDPPFIYNSTGVKRDTDMVYQMGEAIKRGVDVVAVVPGRNNAPWKHYEIQQRRRAAHYLREISESDPKAGNFVIAYLHVGGKDPTVHSKLMLVDDEFALMGSANICQRSIAYITELQLGVVDSEERLVRDLRLALWQEHLELDGPDRLLDPHDGLGEFHNNAAGGKGRLRLMPSERFRFEIPYRPLMNRIIDPYKGPERES